MRSFLLLGIFLAPIWVAQAQQSPKAVQLPKAVQAPLAAKFNPDPQDYPQIISPAPTWVEVVPGCKILVSYYTQGEIIKWQGTSKDGKGHGKGVLTYHDKDGNLLRTMEGELQHGLWQGSARITTPNGITMDVQMRDGFTDGNIKLNLAGASFQGQMVANAVSGPGKRVQANGIIEEGFFVGGTLMRGQIKYTDGQVVYREEGEEVEALSPEKPYNPALGVQLTEYLDENARLCDRAEAQYYRVVTYKAPFRPQGLVRDYYMDGTLQAEFEASYLDSRYSTHISYSGPRKEYSDQGLLLLDQSYVTNELYGTSISYWPNGRKKQQVSWNGKDGEHGPFREWSEAGYLLVDAKYDMGVLVDGRRWEYDQAGRRTLAHLVDFQQDADNWQRQDGDGVSEIYTTYGVNIVPEEGATVLRYAPVQLSGQEDYTVTARMGFVQAGRYGLLLGVQNADNYISFELDGSGMARICRTEGGRIKELKPWKSFPAAASGQELYILNVVCQQGEWHFFCQGEEFFTLPAETLQAYRFGFLAQGQLDAANLEVREAMGSVAQVPAPFPAAKPLQPAVWSKWVQAGPGCEVFEPRFRPGMTLKWEGPVQQGKAHGQGRLTGYVDGQQQYLFEGSCQQGIPTGKGKRTDADGLVWEGNFVDGLPHGQQHIVWPDTHEYHGQAFSGLIHGEGKFSFPDGATLQGFIWDRNLHTGQLTTSEGERVYYYQGKVVEQLPATKKNPYTPALGVPLVEYLDEGGHRCDKGQASYYREVTYKAPFIPQGKVLEYFINGKLSEEYQALYLDADDFSRSLYHGERKLYYENGQLRQQSFYDNGHLNGKVQTYTLAGNLLGEQDWQQHKQYGLHRTWDEQTGSLASETLYINGVQVDQVKHGVVNGVAMQQRHYSDEFSGDASAWTSSGDASVEDDNMLVITGKEDTQSWMLRDIPLTQQEQYMVYSLMGLKEPRKGVSYGLLLGYVDPDNHCELLVRHQGKGGEVAFFSTRNGVRRMLMPWKQIPLQAQSRLVISRKDGQMEVIIDKGTPIALPLTPLAGHKFGACLHGDGVLQLDDFGVLDYVTKPKAQ